MKFQHCLITLVSVTTVLVAPAFASTSGFRFTVVTASGETQRSTPYDLIDQCRRARADYIQHTPRSHYQSVSNCAWRS